MGHILFFENPMEDRWIIHFFFCFSLEEKRLDKNVEISPQFGWLKLK